MSNVLAIILNIEKEKTMNLLAIDVSPRGERSASRRVAAHLVSALRTPDVNFVYRDLAVEAPPHIDTIFLDAFLTRIDERTPAQKTALEYSDMLVDEFMAADTIVISTPMWNYGIPSTLKAWIDHIVRLGLTVNYGANGFEGLAAGKKLFVVVGSGQLYSRGPYAMMDALTHSIRAAFGFIGLDDVEVIRAEGTNIPDSGFDPVSKANAEIDHRYAAEQSAPHGQ